LKMTYLEPEQVRQILVYQLQKVIALPHASKR
jgi:hypothetical protein